jgi:hypothetical protein
MMKSVVLLGDTTPVSLALIDCSPGGFWSLRQGRLVVALCVRCLWSMVCEGLHCGIGFASTGNWYILYVAEDRKKGMIFLNSVFQCRDDDRWYT